MTDPAVVAQMGLPGPIRAAFGTAGILLGGILAFVGLRTLRASASLDGFEVVEARVLESDLESTPRSGGTTYSPAIVYEYTVGGETYTNDAVYPGPLGGSNVKSKHQSVVDDYPEGAVVEAYYDPDDPAVAFLENRSGDPEALVLTGLGVLFLLMGIVFAGPYALSLL